MPSATGRSIPCPGPAGGRASQRPPRGPGSNPAGLRGAGRSGCRARECQSAPPANPTWDSESGRPRRFSSPPQSGAGRLSCRRTMPRSTAARHPVPPATAQRTRPTAPLSTVLAPPARRAPGPKRRPARPAPSASARRKPGCATPASLLESCSASRGSKAAVASNHASGFGPSAAAFANCARHFSTRSLIFFSTPCSVGS